ncbi:MAG: nucleotide exchange factor GrpE [Patescibacteria group bacterium]
MKKLRTELATAKKERDEYLAGWQRSKADYVNLSRRVREDGEGQSKILIGKLSRGIIAVFDSLEAAEAGAKAAGVSESVLSGMNQVVRQLEQALLDIGVSRFSPSPGDAFDSKFHEPIRSVACESEKEDNTISATLQSGFVIGETVLRPARVEVFTYQS